MRSHPAKILLRRRPVAWLAALFLSAALFYAVTYPAAVAAGTTDSYSVPSVNVSADELR